MIAEDFGQKMFLASVLSYLKKFAIADGCIKHDELSDPILALKADQLMPLKNSFEQHCASKTKRFSPNG